MREQGKKKVICVLGMHRSGTSAFGGVLSALGVNMGRELIGAQSDNPKGFYENRKVVKLNDKLFAALGTWSGSALPLPGDHWDDASLRVLKEKAVNIVRSELGDETAFGMKDPRLCRLLPFWLGVFREAGVEPCFVIVLRNPLEVAGSMLARDGAAIERTLMVWAAYMLEAELHSRGLPRAFVAFDDLIENPGKVVGDISDILGIEFPLSYDVAKNDIDRFLDAELKHHTVDDGKLAGYLAGIFSDLYAKFSRFTYRKEITTEELNELDAIGKDFTRLRGFFYYPGFDADAMFQKLYFGGGLKGRGRSLCLRLCVLVRSVRNGLLPPHSKRRAALKKLWSLLFTLGA